MDAKQFAAQLRQIIADLKDQGTAAIYCENLITYLDNVIAADTSAPSPAEMKQYEAQLQLQVEVYRARVETDREEFKAVIQAGQNALRTGFLLNGGASVTILAVIGKFMTAEGSMSYVPPLANSLILFVTGTVLIAFSSALTYLSQWFGGGGKDWHTKVANGLNYVTILIGLSSFGFFVWGMVRAYHVFQW